MYTPVKIGIGLLGFSAVAIPGVWMTVTGEPNPTTLANADVNDYSGKFGEYFKHHLVDAKEGKNPSWWDWSFKYRWSAYKDEEKGGDFTGVTDGKALRTKCEEIYKKESKDDKSVWRYCSLEGQKPVTVKEDVPGISNTETIGKENESNLVSTTDSNNNKFWEIQEKAFFKATNGLGSKATEGSAFKTLYDNKNGTLRKTCQEVYEKKKSDSNADKDKKDALLFCSLIPKTTGN